MKDQKKNTLLVISILMIAIAIFFAFHFLGCTLDFNENVSLGTIINGLIQFGVIAIIIERFTDKFPLNDEYVKYQKVKLGLMTSEDKDSEKKFKKKFYWFSFGLGLLVASIGFRYFDLIVIGYEKCQDVKWANEIFNVFNVFFSGVLLAGGATLVQEIIMWIRKNLLTN